MAEESASSVTAAFEILLEEIEVANRNGAEVVTAGEHDKATEIIQRAKQIAAFRDRVAALLNDWRDFAATPASEAEHERIAVSRRNMGRMLHGSRTPHEAFYGPVLRVIADNGGSAQAKQLIEAIEPLMKPILNDVEYTPLPSDPSKLRWQNRAHWTRLQLVRAGLLKADSPRGIWEITDEGRRWLAERRRNS